MFREYLKTLVPALGQKKVLIVAHSVFGMNLTRGKHDRNPEDPYRGHHLSNVEAIEIDQYLDLDD